MKLSIRTKIIYGLGVCFATASVLGILTVYLLTWRQLGFVTQYVVMPWALLVGGGLLIYFYGLARSDKKIAHFGQRVFMALLFVAVPVVLSLEAISLIIELFF